MSRYCWKPEGLRADEVCLERSQRRGIGREQRFDELTDAAIEEMVLEDGGDEAEVPGVSRGEFLREKHSSRARAPPTSLDSDHGRPMSPATPRLK
jgi:hypothetical protein